MEYFKGSTRNIDERGHQNGREIRKKEIDDIKYWTNERYKQTIQRNSRDYCVSNFRSKYKLAKSEWLNKAVWFFTFFRKSSNDLEI